MITHYNVLYELFQKIPTYGFGSIAELERIRVHFIKEATEIGKDPLLHEVSHKLINRAVALGEVTSLAMKAKSRYGIQRHFDLASNELSLIVELVMMGVRERAIRQPGAQPPDIVISATQSAVALP